MVFKFEDTSIYSVDSSNIALLRNSSYNDGQVSVAVTQKINLTPGKSTNVNQGQNAQTRMDAYCGRKVDIKIDVAFYSSGPSTPAYGQTGNMFCAAGFSYKLKNRKRGWTGIWYGEARSTNNTGYYHSSYNNYTNYNHSDHSVTVDRQYNTKVWSKPWINDIEGAHYWANSILSSLWAYVTGTVTFDLCGNKTWQY